MSHARPELIKAFLPIFYISKFFGCNLYALPNPVTATNINDSPTAINLLICLVHIAVNLIIVIPHIKQWESYTSIFNNEYAARSGYSGLVVIVFIGHIISYGIIVVNCFIPILDLRNATVTRKILFSLIKFDKEMSIGMSIDFKHRIMSWSFGLVTLLLQIPTVILTLIISRDSNDSNDSSVFFIIATHIGFTTNMGCIFSYLTTFWYLSSNINIRFGSINKYLSQRIEDKQKVCQTNSNKNVNIDRTSDRCLNDPAYICSLSDNIRKLVDIIIELSKSNALQLISCTVIFFLSSIVTVFMSYLAFTERITGEPPTTAVFYSIRLMVHGFLLYKAISVGSDIRKQRNITLSLLNKATSLEQNEFALMQLNHFRYQVEHSEMAISCGIFAIDWTLMYTLGTATTTYLFLFLQFDSISTQNKKL